MRRTTILTTISLVMLSTNCVVSGTTATPADNAPLWSPRGVFVFNYLVFDFQKKLEVLGASTTTLVNCSNDSYFCAYAYFLHLVLPKRCPKLFSGQSWSLDGVTTTVLSLHQEGFSSLESFGPTTVALLGDVKFPHLVYKYEIDSGVRAIYLDVNSNLVAAAQSGDMSAYSKREYLLSRTTLDAFGQCAK
jgi:hypothetical protein